MRESERREDILDEREREKERVTPVLCFQYSMHLKESKILSRSQEQTSSHQPSDLNVTWIQTEVTFWALCGTYGPEDTTDWNFDNHLLCHFWPCLSFSLFIRSFVTRALYLMFLHYYVCISSANTIFSLIHMPIYISDPSVCVSLNWSPPRQHLLMLLVMSQSSDIDFRDDSAYLFSSTTVYWSL